MEKIDYIEISSKILELEDHSKFLSELESKVKTSLSEEQKTQILDSMLKNNFVVLRFIDLQNDNKNYFLIDDEGKLKLKVFKEGFLSKDNNFYDLSEPLKFEGEFECDLHVHFHRQKNLYILRYTIVFKDNIFSEITNIQWIKSE